MEEIADIKTINDLKKVLKSIIESRIMGTGVHIDTSEKGKPTISYKRFHIWGILGALNKFVDYFYQLIIEGLPRDLDNFDSRNIENKIQEISKIYQIREDILLQRLKSVKEPKENWNYMDIYLKCAVIISAFFDSFDETMIYRTENQEIDAILLTILERNSNNPKKIKYNLEDFGFVFRARIYCSWLSNQVYNGSYSNVVRRLDNILKELYFEYFSGKDIDKLKDKQNRSANKTDNKESDNYINNLNSQESSKIKDLIQQLKSNNKQEIIEAIDYITDNKITSLMDNLEYLFNYPDEEIMNKAFDSYIMLKS